MIKRKYKITALLVAATSIVTLVPAMAANSTSRLGTKDGTIQHAIAFKDGKYLYEGYKSDDDDQSIYYNGGNKDKSLDDVEDSDIQARLTTSAEAYTTDGSYQDKYAYVKDGSDEYLIDLTTGKINDDDTPSDILDTATTKLKSALKKTDRYGDISTKSTAIEDIYAIPGTKFESNTWYEYHVKPISKQDNSTSTGYLYGFTNQSGKYVDASNLANIYAYSTTKGKYVKIEEYDKYDSDNELTATLTAPPEVLAQDKDYIYAKVTVNIIDSNDNSTAIGTTTGAAAVIGGDTTDTQGDGNYKVSTHTYIQKISKTQGDKKDDAYIPKSVTSYEVTKGVLDSGDADDAYDAINNADAYSVDNGQLLAINASSSNVKVTTINLKKDKVKYNSAYAPTLNNGTSFGTSDKVDVYLAEKDDSDDVDVDNENAWDVDVDGKVWVVADGKIYKFVNNEMTKVYTTDSSLDSISVYDENNIIAWEEDGDIYTTVNEGKAETESEAPSTTAPTTPANVGWSQLADGSWNFYDATGTKVANNWVNVGGTWYFLDPNGAMATGWRMINGSWYYLNPLSDGTRGAMKTGWINDNGTWYYLNSSGAMKTGWINDNGTWYYLNSSGAMKTGWINDGGTWYFLYENGSMAANTTIGGYRLSSSGALI